MLLNGDIGPFLLENCFLRLSEFLFSFMSKILLPQKQECVAVDFISCEYSKHDLYPLSPRF